MWYLVKGGVNNSKEIGIKNGQLGVKVEGKLRLSMRYKTGELVKVGDSVLIERRKTEGVGVIAVALQTKTNRYSIFLRSL